MIARRCSECGCTFIPESVARADDTCGHCKGRPLLDPTRTCADCGMTFHPTLYQLHRRAPRCSHCVAALAERLLAEGLSGMEAA